MHIPVLLQDVMKVWLTDESGIYIDGTFGRGGHSKVLLGELSDKAQLLGIDQDLTAVEHAKQTVHDPRFAMEYGSFKDIKAIAEKYGIANKVSGILLDIGVSSPQLDEAGRGFSFLQDGPLDMRMNQEQALSAKTWINAAKEEDMVYVFKTYGEERFAKRIARAICDYRKDKEITRTLQLAEIVAKANPKWEKHKNPATRVFQAIRIHVNNELEVLERALQQCLDILKPGGHLVVISFHSLEDRIVKRFFKEQAQGRPLPKGLPVKENFIDRKVKLISKAIKAGEAELDVNPRARSAVLRAVEKLK